MLKLIAAHEGERKREREREREVWEGEQSKGRYIYSIFGILCYAMLCYAMVQLIRAKQRLKPLYSPSSTSSLGYCRMVTCRLCFLCSCLLALNPRFIFFYLRLFLKISIVFYLHFNYYVDLSKKIFFSFQRARSRCKNQIF